MKAKRFFPAASKPPRYGVLLIVWRDGVTSLLPSLRPPTVTVATTVNHLDASPGLTALMWRLVQPGSAN